MDLVRALIPEELAKAKGEVEGESGNYERAARIFEAMSTSEQFPEFLTLALYEELE